MTHFNIDRSGTLDESAIFQYALIFFVNLLIFVRDKTGSFVAAIAFAKANPVVPSFTHHHGANNNSNNNRANVTLTKPLNNLEAIDALSKYFISRIMTELQLLGQQLIELLFKRGKQVFTFVARDSTL